MDEYLVVLPDTQNNDWVKNSAHDAIDKPYVDDAVVT